MSNHKGLSLLSLALSVLLLIPAAVVAQDFIIVQSTTSTQNSGLFDHLLPLYQKRSGVEVRVVAVGTGQALKNARNGDGDLLIVHAKSAEEAFVAAGYGLPRRDLMYNDFVLIGPASDPAGISSASDVAAALQNIAGQQAAFVSRGDDSGTHKKEIALWNDAGIDASEIRDSWYRETGSGMGASLNIAAAMEAYILSDRATWISFANKGNLRILFAGDNALFNQYGVIVVNPAKHTWVKGDLAQAFADWLLGAEGQSAIAEYTVDGQQLFYPNANN